MTARAQPTTARGGEQRREQDATAFIAGGQVVGDDGVVVRFADDCWRIAGGSVSFVRLPQWLRVHAKALVARLWLDDGCTLSRCRAVITACGEWASAIPEFTGAGLEDLTPDHAHRVLTHYRGRVEAARAAIEESEARRGPLRGRSRSAVVRQAGGLLKPQMHLSNIAAVCALAHEREGLDIRFNLKAQAVGRAEARSPGSAEAWKVLDSMTEGALLRACDRELRRYEHAQELIAWAFRDCDWSVIRGKEVDPTPFIERFLGRNGREIMGADETAVALGRSPTAGPSILRRVRRHLEECVGTLAASEILELRRRLKPPLLAAIPAADRARLRAEFDVRLDEGLVPWEEPNRRAIRLYFGLGGTRPHSYVEVGRVLGKSSARGPFFRVTKHLAGLLGECRSRRVRVLRDALEELCTRAIKAQAVKLDLAAARRIGALVEIPADLEMRHFELEGMKVVQIQFVAHKTWGEEGVRDPVVCVDVYGEIAVQAIDSARQLTEPLRDTARAGCRELLFLIPDGGFSAAVPLSEKVLSEYLFTSQKGKDGGLLRRYGLPEHISLHHFRHSHATKAKAGGASLASVARYLGHGGAAGNPLMAHVWYVAGGSPELREKTVEELQRGQARGRTFDPVARLMIRAMGLEELVTDVPAAQLSYEDALARIHTGDIIDPMPFTPEDAVRMLRNGVILNVTRYGGCLLPAESGLCPSGHRCPIGITPEDGEVKQGLGCRYQVVMPHGIEALDADLSVLYALREEVSDMPQEQAKFDVQIGIWETQRECAVALSKIGQRQA